MKGRVIFKKPAKMYLCSAQREEKYETLIKIRIKNAWNSSFSLNVNVDWKSGWRFNPHTFAPPPNWPSKLGPSWLRGRYPDPPLPPQPFFKVCLQPHQCDSALIMGCCCSPTVQVLHPSWNAGLRGRSPLQNFIIDTSVFTLWRVTLCEKWIPPAFPKMWKHSCHHAKQSESPIWRKRQHLVGCLSQRVKVNFK